MKLKNKYLHRIVKKVFSFFLWAFNVPNRSDFLGLTSVILCADFEWHDTDSPWKYILQVELSSCKLVMYREMRLILSLHDSIILGYSGESCSEKQHSWCIKVTMLARTGAQIAELTSS